MVREDAVTVAITPESVRFSALLALTMLLAAKLMVPPKEPPVAVVLMVPPFQVSASSPIAARISKVAVDATVVPPVVLPSAVA